MYSIQEESSLSVIPQEYRDLLEKPVVVSLATVLPNGQVQVTPVWCDFDGKYIRINTVVGRQKYKAMIANPQVTIMALDPENPYRYLEVRGTVVKISEDGADDHIDKLAHDYTGAERYQWRQAADTRTICFVEPVKALPHG
jgi:PPOX class probable F420-dependent enzyme